MRREEKKRRRAEEQKNFGFLSADRQVGFRISDFGRKKRRVEEKSLREVKKLRS